MAITLSEAAIRELQAQKIKALEELKGKGQPVEILYLRLGVLGGGCSGLSYRLEWDTVTDQHDVRFPIANIIVVVDKKSYLYLNGTEIDYIPGVQGRFDFKNPNAASTCGCQASFHPKTERL